eukprot:512637_1
MSQLCKVKEALYKRNTSSRWSTNDTKNDFKVLPYFALYHRFDDFTSAQHDMIKYLPKPNMDLILENNNNVQKETIRLFKEYNERKEYKRKAAKTNKKKKKKRKFIPLEAEPDYNPKSIKNRRLNLKNDNNNSSTVKPVIDTLSSCNDKSSFNSNPSAEIATHKNTSPSSSDPTASPPSSKPIVSPSAQPIASELSNSEQKSKELLLSESSDEDANTSFNLSGSNLKLDGNTVTCVRNTTKEQGHSAFGAQLLSSGGMEWTIRIKTGHSICIGVCGSAKTAKNALFTETKYGYGYGDDGRKSVGGVYSRYHYGFKEGDIVRVYLNLNLKTLQFTVGDHSHGIAFYSMELNPNDEIHNYRLAVSLHHSGHKVVLLQSMPREFEIYREILDLSVVKRMIEDHRRTICGLIPVDITSNINVLFAGLCGKVFIVNISCRDLEGIVFTFSADQKWHMVDPGDKTGTKQGQN